MMRLFSRHGRIGRASFALRLVVGLFVMLLGAVIPMVIGLLSMPWGIGNDETSLWSHESAEFVKATFGAISPKLILLAFFLFGLRIWLCAAMQRARDFGVEFSTVFNVPLHWMNPSSRAHFGHLIGTPGLPAIENNGARSD